MNPTREALQLMMGPPIQLASSREARAARQKRTKDQDRWRMVVAQLQIALQMGLEAASKDGGGAPSP